MPDSMVLLIYKMLGHFAIVTTLAGVLAVDINYKDQVTLGTIILTGIVIITAGIFTIRANIARGWHDAYEVEKTEKEQARKALADEKLKKVEFEKEQQELRHTLKGDIAARDLIIQSLQAKTDLSTALDAIRQIAEAQNRGHEQTHLLLTEIRDTLKQDAVLTEIRDSSQ